MSPPLTYQASGIDIAATDRFVERVAAIAATSHTPAVLRHASQYAGLLRLDAAGMSEPVPQKTSGFPA